MDIRMDMKFKLTTVLLASTMLAACGKHSPTEKNPLDGYQAVNTAVVPYNEVAKDQFRRVKFYEISNVEDLNFVQGQEKSVHFMVNVNLQNANPSHYTLQGQQLPEGATLTRDRATGMYIFKWKPAADTLSQTENGKIIKIKFQFVPIKANNPNYDFMRAQTDLVPKEVSVTVNKYSQQPVLSEKIIFRPSQTIKADQTATVELDVVASGARYVDDVQVNTISGPDNISRELVQLDGVMATIAKVSRVREQISPDGTVKASYQVRFVASRFVEILMQQINADPILKKRYADCKLTSAEASFNVQVINKYNASTSVERNVILIVELPAPVAGCVSTAADAQAVEKPAAKAAEVKPAVKPAAKPTVAPKKKPAAVKPDSTVKPAAQTTIAKVDSIPGKAGAK